MTRKRLTTITAASIATYACAMVVGVILRIAFPAQHSVPYETYRDLIPLLIALPAVHLAYAIQSRASYVSALRAVWTDMAEAASGALVYTELSAPSQAEYAEVLRKLVRAIELIRAVYQNVPASVPSEGWYPFEPLKQIYQEIKALGFGPEASESKRSATHHRVYELWKNNRRRFLREMDVAIPTYHHAEYSNPRLRDDGSRH